MSAGKWQQRAKRRKFGTIGGGRERGVPKRGETPEHPHWATDDGERGDFSEDFWVEQRPPHWE